MELIVLVNRRRVQRSIHLGQLRISLLAVFFVTAVGGAFWFGMEAVPRVIVQQPDPSPFVNTMQRELKSQSERVSTVLDRTRNNMGALAQRLSDLTARSIRLEALGERLVQLQGLDPAEFNFSDPPSRGGLAPLVKDDVEQVPNFIHSLEELAWQLENRSQAYSVLESSLIDNRHGDEMRPAGNPLGKGWISSRFGWRSDPMTGARSFHYGVDIPGASGQKIYAVAAGIVIFSGRRKGHGRMIDIDHGKGFVSRYAHNKKNKVVTGQRVARGDTVALLGSSGRSTGPHVHFEVMRFGKHLNPAKYIKSGSTLAEVPCIILNRFSSFLRIR